MSWYYWVGGGLLLYLILGIRILRPIEVGLIEFLGGFRKTVNAGFHIILPGIHRLWRVNMTERMVDVRPQTVITKDKLNALVDAVVYYQIKDAKKSMYNVDNHREQLTSLARTTLRAVIGKMTLTDANENRDEINTQVETVLDKETDSYGVEVLRVEIQTIEPPEDVQISMNKVVKAEQEKIAANDLASAAEIQADGLRRAEIKKSEGIKQGLILKSEGEASAIKMVADAKAFEIQTVNSALNLYFKDDAQIFKKLETAENSFRNGSKYVIDSKSNIMNVMSDVAGVVPVPHRKRSAKPQGDINLE